MSNSLNLALGDHPVAVLAPDAHLVVDSATCIVLVTPERRITVSNAGYWRVQLEMARVFAHIYQEWEGGNHDRAIPRQGTGQRGPRHG